MIRLSTHARRSRTNLVQKLDNKPGGEKIHQHAHAIRHMAVARQ
jgi:hypothetical protein